MRSVRFRLIDTSLVVHVNGQSRFYEFHWDGALIGEGADLPSMSATSVPLAVIALMATLINNADKWARCSTTLQHPLHLSLLFDSKTNLCVADWLVCLAPVAVVTAETKPITSSPSSSSWCSMKDDRRLLLIGETASTEYRSSDEQPDTDDRRRQKVMADAMASPMIKFLETKINTWSYSLGTSTKEGLNGVKCYIIIRAFVLTLKIRLDRFIRPMKSI